MLTPQQLHRHPTPAPAQRSFQLKSSPRRFAQLPKPASPKSVVLQQHFETRRQFSAGAPNKTSEGDVVPFNLADIGEGIAGEAWYTNCSFADLVLFVLSLSFRWHVRQ